MVINWIHVNLYSPAEEVLGELADAVGHGAAALEVGGRSEGALLVVELLVSLAVAVTRCDPVAEANV
jgi:hypothetical protein